MPDTEPRKEAHYQQERTHKGVLRDTVTRGRTVGRARLAVSRRNTTRSIRACAAGVANGRGGTRRKAGANGGKDIGGRQSTANGSSVDKGRRNDHHAALVLCVDFTDEFGVDLVLLRTIGIFNALVDSGSIHLGMFVGVIDTVLVGKVDRIATTIVEFDNVVPPDGANSIRGAVLFPNAESTEGFLDHVGTRNPAIEVIVWVGGTVAAVIGAERVTKVLSVGLAAHLDSVVNVHVGSKVGGFSESLRERFEGLEKILGNGIRRSGPEIVLDPIIGVRKRPGHFNLDRSVCLDFVLDGINVVFEHEKGRNGNVPAGSVIGHDGFRVFTVIGNTRFGLAIEIGAEAGRVSDDDSGSPGPLGVANLLDKGTAATIHH